MVSRNAEDGIIVAIEQATDTKIWETAWLLTVDCAGGDAIINDVAIRPDGTWSEEPFSTRRPSNRPAATY